MLGHTNQGVERLGVFSGGFIGYIEDYSSLGMSEQNYQWISEAFRGLSNDKSFQLDFKHILLTQRHKVTKDTCKIQINH